METISQEVVLASGRKITKYILKNNQGMWVEVISLGATLTKIMVPDSEGNVENVVLEWADINTYEQNPGCFGAVIGRIAGRINEGQVTINDEKYSFFTNSKGHTLHGGKAGFHTKVWKGSFMEGEDEVALVLSYLSEDGEEGFPGNLQVQVIYHLKQDNTLTLEYKATTDKETIVNLTNHAYFNLSGNAKRSILDEELYVNSNTLCDLDENLIPKGKYIDLSINEKAFDFRKAKPIGRDIEMDSEQLKNGAGYDHCWMLEEGDVAVRLYDPISKRVMEVCTDQPGIVIYTMNHADSPILLSSGQKQEKRYAVCFEAQKQPIGYNEVNKEEVLLKSGETYKQETSFRFSVR